MMFYIIPGEPLTLLFLHCKDFTFVQNLTMELKEQFEQAVLTSKTLSQKPDNETLLTLYALYKQSTEGDITAEPPSNPFDFVAKAKFNAWEGLKGKPGNDAMQEYIDLVTKLKGV